MRLCGRCEHAVSLLNNLKSKDPKRPIKEEDDE